MEPSVVVKVFRLLETLGNAPSGSLLGATAESVGMPKPTVHRLLKSMIELGYVAQAENGHYQLTSRLDLLRRSSLDRRLLTAADPILFALHKKTGENVNLGILRSDRVMYLRVLESTHALRRIAEPNSTDPVHSTALGRSIAAYMEPALRDALLRRTEPFVSRTPHTVTDIKKIRDIFNRVRVDGYAAERNETDLGVACYGAPIFDQDRTVVAAVSLSVPSARCDAERELIEQVKSTAQKISSRLCNPNGEKTWR